MEIEKLEELRSGEDVWMRDDGEYTHISIEGSNENCIHPTYRQSLDHVSQLIAKAMGPPSQDWEPSEEERKEFQKYMEKTEE